MVALDLLTAICGGASEHHVHVHRSVCPIRQFLSGRDGFAHRGRFCGSIRHLEHGKMGCLGLLDSPGLYIGCRSFRRCFSMVLAIAAGASMVIRKPVRSDEMIDQRDTLCGLSLMKSAHAVLGFFLPSEGPVLMPFPK